MRRFSRAGIHPMVGAGLAIREAFGEYLLREVQLTMQHTHPQMPQHSGNEHIMQYSIQNSHSKFANFKISQHYLKISCDFFKN
jgi:hypothetical protein